MKHTYQEYWAFVNRAETTEQIEIARVYLAKQKDIPNFWYDQFMDALDWKSRKAYRRNYGR